ncbi:F-box domain-containing protein [Mycena venus]|uniref:F-box domain-containing protein n=1 Tax=Mycena venus TaxID=2733690 RepID=A0A8H6ZBI8_9AGAR|nr:F-box domain-containing protein [Mycena venus]
MSDTRCRKNKFYYFAPSSLPFGVSPPEILSEIFLLLLTDVTAPSTSYSSIDVLQPPLLLGFICSKWRTVALSTSRLWASIRFSPPKLVSQGIASLFDLFAERSRPIPIGLDSGFGRALHRHASHRRMVAEQQIGEFGAPHSTGIPPTSGGHARVYVSRAAQSRHIPTVRQFKLLPAFIGTIAAFAHAPCLRNLKLESKDSSPVLWPFAARFPWAQLTSLHLSSTDELFQIRTLVSQCLELETCTIIRTTRYLPDTPIPAEECVLTKLHTLVYKGPIDDDNDDGDIEDMSAEFFKPFSFPQLRALSIDMVAWPAEFLSELYQRSHFELTSLTMGHLHLSVDHIVPFLSSIPTVKDLTLEYGTSVDESLFVALTYSSADPHATILPELVSLAIKTNDETDYSSSTVADLFESRWWPSPAPNSPSLQIPSATSRLKHATFQFGYETFIELDQSVKTRLDVMKAAGVLDYSRAPY